MDPVTRNLYCRNMCRAVRKAFTDRRKLTIHQLSQLLNSNLPYGSQTHVILTRLLSKVARDEMEVDTATSAWQPRRKILSPEPEMLSFLYALLFLIDKRMYREAKICASAIIVRLKSLKRWSADVFKSKSYSYCSLSYELSGDLAEIRGELLALHCLPTLHHDELSQETLLNLLLRNYLHYNLYDHAEKLRSKAPCFKAHSQHYRYLFYVGKIQTIQLEYTDAKESLLQAARKAPVRARGFRIQCNKWAVIVQLLLGEIPERTTFMQRGMEKALEPYYELTNAVRIGDLELFRRVAEKFSDTFLDDRTHNLFRRLRHSVIRIGLKNISISYSRISLADVAKKLRLDTSNPAADAESIVAKAIRDGVVDATLDHANGWMLSKETGNIYSTFQPQAAFDLRITFCLTVNNEATWALRYPPNSRKDKLIATKKRIKQLLRQIVAKRRAKKD